MSVGERIHALRKALKLSQKDFADRIRVSYGFLSNLEKGVRLPSDQLLKLISYEFSSSEKWLNTGQGEMFISLEDQFKEKMARFGERAVVEAFSNIMKERGLAVAAGRPAHRADTGDPDLDRMVNTIYDLWSAGDEKFKHWVEVQFDRAFPADVVEEAQKKQKETQGQASAG